MYAICTRTALIRVVSSVIFSFCSLGMVLTQADMTGELNNTANGTIVGEIFSAIKEHNNKRYDELIEQCSDYEKFFKIAEDTEISFLCYAAAHNNIYIVKDLIKRGVNPQQGGPQRGSTAFHWALAHQNDEIARELLVYIDYRASYAQPILEKWSELHWAAAFERPAIISELITLGFNPNSVAEPYKVTPLHVAVKMSKIASAQVLIEQGASLEVIDYEGATPLMKAVFENNCAMAKLLLDYKADIRTKTNYFYKILPSQWLSWFPFFVFDITLQRSTRSDAMHALLQEYGLQGPPLTHALVTWFNKGKTTSSDQESK